MDMTQYFQYNTSSPSCLVWSDGANSDAIKKAERVPFTYAGSQQLDGSWQVQVIIGDKRHRSTAHRIIWQLHNGPIPKDWVVIHRLGDHNDIDNLMCINRQHFNWLKAWKHGVANVRETKGGRYFATIRGHRSLGTYDTYAEAELVYRTQLEFLIEHLL